MTTYCSNPRCDNRCGRKPPDNLTGGTYSWADFCEPPSFICVGVAEEDEADPDEPTDAEPTTMTMEEMIRSAPTITMEIDRQATEEDFAEIADEWFGPAEEMPDLPPLPESHDVGGSD